ncbi:class I SAM-dependent methyltransferase [Roseobacter sp. S98]|uniref:class I SAM-dependent methyltransferase n=1 Tax=Roseobacter algicola (ex Choi et al. 2025) (nom. illeg.) TaxID=3092138 RepID=UPI0035C6683B
MTGDNTEQRDFWSDAAGPKWVEMQVQMDQLMQPVLDALWSRAGLQPGQNALDVGSGTGASTLQAADLVAPGGTVTGADISDSMTALARTRTVDHDGVSLLLADVAEHRFPAASFDAVISRFGVMFFADSDAAFANIRASMVPGAQLCFAAWAQIPDNPWFTLAASVAKPITGAPPRPDPDAPGPFAFRDPERVHGHLTAGGFSDIRIETADILLDGGDDPRVLAETMCRIGPAEVALRFAEADTRTEDAVRDALAMALDAYTTPEGLRVPASIHFVTARA